MDRLSLSNQEMLKAMTERDAAYDGRFLVGVRTTGVYCLPSCRGRLPKPENVEFFANAESARRAGLRPCKRCRPPASKRSAAMIAYTSSVDSPFGPMVCAVDNQGAVLLVEFTTEQPRKEILFTLKEDGYELEEAEERTAEVCRQLREYFSGERRDFDLPLAMAGTPFQRQVWQALRSIPFGETRTYRQISESIGRPRATRAVGAANGANRIAIVVPCHRVVGSDGSLTGYAGGIEVKRWLLMHEAPRSPLSVH